MLRLRGRPVERRSAQLAATSSTKARSTRSVERLERLHETLVATCMCLGCLHSTALRAEVRALFLLSGNVWLEALERCRVLRTCNNNGKDDGKQSVKYDFVVAKSCCVHPLACPQSTVATAAEPYAAPGAGSSIDFSKSLCRCSRWDGGLFFCVVVLLMVLVLVVVSLW